MKSPPGGTELEAIVAQRRAKLRERPPPERIVTPGPGQESVWDYPRPPRVAVEPRRIQVILAGRTIAGTSRALRVTETGGAPVYYLPRADVAAGVLAETGHWTICEWKGVAFYFDVVAGAHRAARAAWHYPDPLDDLGEDYARLRGHVAFYPALMDACFVGGERATSQPGAYYGGWITREVTGPFKGEPGSENW